MSSYKTVLAHINDERRATRLIEFATLFARAHDAHLIGLFVVPLPVVLNEWPDIAIADMIETQRKAYRDEAGRISEIFRDKTAQLSRPAEWRQQESQYATVAEALIQNARTVDIVIAPQPDSSWHLTNTLDGAETVIMESGRPVLVVPNAGNPSPTPSNVTIAWNNRKESTRAAFDAMPIIQHAGHADIVWIDPHVGSLAAGDLPGAELAATLARHGVEANAKSIAADDDGVAAALRLEAERAASGLLVMGAYGHSRLREFILGGATRDTMRDMTLPVLFSH